MPDPERPDAASRDAHSPLRVRPDPSDPVVCERCGGANVYRMHAVWRCADCGYKTDCCGW